MVSSFVVGWMQQLLPGAAQRPKSETLAFLALCDESQGAVAVEPDSAKKTVAALPPAGENSASGSGGMPPESPLSGGMPPESGGVPPVSGGMPPESHESHPGSGGGSPEDPQDGSLDPASAGVPPQSGGMPPETVVNMLLRAKDSNGQLPGITQVDADD